MVIHFVSHIPSLFIRWIFELKNLFWSSRRKLRWVESSFIIDIDFVAFHLKIYPINLSIIWFRFKRHYSKPWISDLFEISMSSLFLVDENIQTKRVVINHFNLHWLLMSRDFLSAFDWIDDQQLTSADDAFVVDLPSISLVILFRDKLDILSSRKSTSLVFLMTKRDFSLSLTSFFFKCSKIDLSDWPIQTNSQNSSLLISDLCCHIVVSTMGMYRSIDVTQGKDRCFSLNIQMYWSIDEQRWCISLIVACLDYGHALRQSLYYSISDDVWVFDESICLSPTTAVTAVTAVEMCRIDMEYWLSLIILYLNDFCFRYWGSSISTSN